MIYTGHIPIGLLECLGRFESHGRHQHVLDFSRKEVVDYIYEMISKVIRESRISYIKWDMNRYMTEPYSRGAAADEQGKVMHRYILGVYDLYTRLTQEFPEILFESCASGGAVLTRLCCFLRPRPGPVMTQTLRKGPKFSMELLMCILWSAWVLMYLQCPITRCSAAHHCLPGLIWHILEPLAMNWT